MVDPLILSVSVIPSAAIILLILSPSLLFAYYVPIELEPAAEVVVRFQQEAGAEKRKPRQWGLCSLGDPDRPGAVALRALGDKAVPLFVLATDYPLRTYLDQTPLEYNLRYVVGQKLQEEARLEEDRRRLEESRKKYVTLLRDLGIQAPSGKRSYTLDLPRSIETRGAESGRHSSILSTSGASEGAVRVDSLPQGRRSASTNSQAIGETSPYHGPPSDLEGEDLVKRSIGPQGVGIVRPSREEPNQKELAVNQEELRQTSSVVKMIALAVGWVENNWQVIGLGFVFLYGLAALARRG